MQLLTPCPQKGILRNSFSAEKFHFTIDLMLLKENGKFIDSYMQSWHHSGCNV